ncbi:MAG: F0F1 ATP synthase subunit C [Deltaproteobacteria bacterium]|nr:MAG: F0F1 ATP synthase subunit C [Deltaproteobacteria bacterium]
MSKRIATFATLFAVTFLAPSLALAAEGTSGPNDGVYAIAMALGMGLAVFGGGLGQGRAASAALEGICRNPNSVDKVFTPMLLGLAFVESLVIFMFVTAFLIYGKFGF